MPALQEIARQPGFAALGLVVGGGLWGLLWVPIRAMEQTGLTGAWPGIAIYACAIALMIPILIRVKARVMAHIWVLIPCGLLTGCAFSLYTTSLVLTDVVRSVLLFYLTPVWSTLLGIVFLGERLTPARTAALTLGLCGLLVILGVGALRITMNAGDLMALFSGISWAIGTLFLFRAGNVAISEQVFAFICGAFLVTGLTLATGVAATGIAVTGASVVAAAPWGLITGLVLVPTLFMTIWPATVLSPARVGLLLMSEIIVGVVTAAIWSGDVFGWREAVGSLLIVSAGAVEVLGHRQPKPQSLT
ncbi:DMT family transporter [Nioella nitratireducens]|uniref:DMT family transporter n=1 Tax=Nioella nitratireducens TaxID=1287720 RepID=UPI0008FD169D|nr:DMT family transporter [Nioella nitratireducens]